MTSASQGRVASELDRERLADLMEAVARHQDRDAFAQLFTYYAPRLKGYLLRLGAGDGAAEELTQEVMITLWRKAALFDRRQASVSTWLFRVARNRRIDMLRRDGRPDLDVHEPMLQPEPEIAPDDSLSAAEREGRVRAAVAALPPQQADLLRLAFYEGLSHRDIAARTDIPLGTVKSRLRLAFQRLRAVLADEDPESQED